jgi:hypothetical protein
MAWKTAGSHRTPTSRLDLVEVGPTEHVPEAEVFRSP